MLYIAVSISLVCMPHPPLLSHFSMFFVKFLFHMHVFFFFSAEYCFKICPGGCVLSFHCDLYEIAALLFCYLSGTYMFCPDQHKSCIAIGLHDCTCIMYNYSSNESKRRNWGEEDILIFQTIKYIFTDTL